MTDLIRFLHILSMSVWIGAALWVPGDVRRTLGAGGAQAQALAARVRPALGVDAVAGVATLVTGLLLMWALGMGRPRVGIAVGFLLTLVRLGMLAGMRRAARTLLARLAAGEAVGPTDPAARRMAMLSGIAHTAWLVTLAAMVFPV